jgi:hypothetical protein
MKFRRCQGSFCGLCFVEMTGSWTNVWPFFSNDWKLNKFWLFCWNDWKLYKCLTVLLKWLEVEQMSDRFVQTTGSWTNFDFFAEMTGSCTNVWPSCWNDWNLNKCLIVLLKWLEVEQIFDCFVEMTGSWTNVWPFCSNDWKLNKCLIDLLKW